MKNLALLLTVLVAGCQKSGDATPNTEKAADEVEIITQGRNRDCGVAQVVAIDSAQVRRGVGRVAYAPVYLALKLDTALWVRKSQTLLVRIRKPQPGEHIACTAMGPGYTPFVVTSARVKPSSE